MITQRTASSFAAGAICLWEIVNFSPDFSLAQLLNLVVVLIRIAAIDRAFQYSTDGIRNGKKIVLSSGSAAHSSSFVNVRRKSDRFGGRKR